MNVREKLPVRRKNPSKPETGNNYGKHKPNLQEDFHFCCGYCGSFDGFGYTKTYFEIDHFVPKDFLIKTNSEIGLSKYSNLVYSCRFCNNYKTKHWPSQRENIYIKENEGFIEPCNLDYESHLYRTDEGAIMWSTPIGKWMATTAFRFDERIEELKLLWKYNKTRLTIEKIIDELNTYPTNSNEYKEIKCELTPLFEKHYFIQKELATFYNG